jgi:ribosomal protein L32
VQDSRKRVRRREEKRRKAPESEEDTCGHYDFTGL